MGPTSGSHGGEVRLLAGGLNTLCVPLPRFQGTFHTAAHETLRMTPQDKRGGRSLYCPEMKWLAQSQPTSEWQKWSQAPIWRMLVVSGQQMDTPAAPGTFRVELPQITAAGGHKTLRDENELEQEKSLGQKCCKLSSTVTNSKPIELH